MPIWAIGVFILEGLVTLYFAGVTVYYWGKYDGAQTRN
jgi:hypothetical protein